MSGRLRFSPLWICLPVAIFIAIWYLRGATGIYVGQGPNLVTMFNIVESWDGKVTGQYQEVTLEDNGTVKDRVFSVTGTASGGNISFTTLENIPLAVASSMSGTYNGSSITLTFLGKNSTPITETVAQSNLAMFESLTKQLQDKSKAILAANASAKALAEEKAYAIKNIGATVQAAVLECREKRLSGEYTTYAASANCSNRRITQAYQNIDYPFMDLVEQLTAERLQVAQKVDAGQITEAAAQKELSGFINYISTIERQRNGTR